MFSWPKGSKRVASMLENVNLDQVVYDRRVRVVRRIISAADELRGKHSSPPFKMSGKIEQVIRHIKGCAHPFFYSLLRSYRHVFAAHDTVLRRI